MSTYSPQNDDEILIFKALTLDKACHHSKLTDYLKQIKSGHNVVFLTSSDKPIVIDHVEAWRLIFEWSRGNEGGLPVGDKVDKYSAKTQATKLLDYVEIDVQTPAREAAANLQAIKKSYVDMPLNKYNPTTPVGQNYKKINDLRNLQYQLINDKFLGKLESEIQQTAYLKRFAGDPHTLSVLSGILAANAANLRQNSRKDALDLADEIHKLVILRSGDGSINNAIHLAHSDAGEEELKELSKVLEDNIQRSYGNDLAGEKEFLIDMSTLSSLTRVTSVADIETLIEIVAGHDKSKASLIAALRKKIVSTSNSSFVSGEEILGSALTSIGLTGKEYDTTYNELVGISPLIEEARQNEVGKFLGGNLRESDPRLLHVQNLASDIGVSPDILWLTTEDLRVSGEELLKKYNVKDFDELEQLLQTELGKTDHPNLKAIIEIDSHFKNSAQHNRYEQLTASDTLYYLRDRIGKIKGNFAAQTTPARRFYQKIKKDVSTVDNFIHSPFVYISDQVEKLKDRSIFWNILTPTEFISKKIIDIQAGIALKIYRWSSRASKSGHWYSGAFNQVAQFSKIFYRDEASWSEASHHFIKQKWGNILDWGAKKAGVSAGWKGVKVKIGTKLWNGFSKLAPGLAEKAAKGGLQKLVASLLLGELTAGTSLLIQIAGMVIWAGIKGVWKFITDHTYRDNFITNKLPGIMAFISIGFTSIPAFIAGTLIAIGSSALALMSAAMSSLFTMILLPAMITVGSIILTFFLFFQIFNITKNIDSGTGQMISNIICSLTESGAPSASSNPRLAAGKCIYELLSKAGINPLNRGNAAGSAFAVFASALGNQAASDQAKKSATNYATFQCSGFNMVVRLMTGEAADFTNAKDLIAFRPSGLKFVAGVESCSPGDFFVDTNGDWGHTGLFVESAGAVIKCLDANSDALGKVRDETTCTWPSSRIAGCLKNI